MKGALLLALALGGCAAIPPPRATPAIEVISYDMQPGFMVPSGYKIVVASTGEGVMTLEYRDHGQWRTSYRRIHVTAGQFAAFRAQLGKYRPAGHLELGTPETCAEYDDDADVLQVAWSGGTAPPATLRFSVSCDYSAQTARALDLRNAAERLGLSPEKLLASLRRD
ncbi:hypothetical protein OF829_02340 [Sphingomonas sp. LB-2]|uniref:hypothetical protein n=1 Tax=Sphingomonas caeni TaxID=2984949 RepID=UPI00222F14D0|nr:hypothetical protein [Sphingomonas caeni]MCW3846060.1 hypothetical protein [Sphingomonas caeni]